MNARALYPYVCPALLFLSGCHRRLPVPAVTAPAAAPAAPSQAGEPRDSRVERYLLKGGASLKIGRPAAAVRDFHNCLTLDSGNRECLNGKGLAHAALRQWEDAVLAWEELALRDGDAVPSKRLAAARRSWQAHKRRRAKFAVRFPIGAGSAPADAPLRLKLVARFQRYSTSTLDAADVYDPDIDSPKSALFSPDGGCVYVNSLEGGKTVVYGGFPPVKRAVIRHRFGSRDAGLFPGEEPWFGYAFSEDLPPGGPNVFSGKPVESAFSHGGRYLWVPYYRRDFDLYGTQPSAVAVIDTAGGEIARVLPVGPIAKNVAASPDGRYMAVSHWGGNSVGFIGISSSDPAAFVPAGLVALGPMEPPPGAEGMDRDSECGFCVRGLAWAPDSRYLFAGCMGGPGGVAVIDASRPAGPALAGRVAVGGKPRDLAVSPDGKWLFATFGDGSLTRLELARLTEAAVSTSAAAAVSGDSVKVGRAPRSMRFSPDGKWLFVALNGDSLVAAVDTAEMRVVARAGADSFPVGLGISPDGRFLWVTSQGISAAGGNSVGVFEITVARKPDRFQVPPLP